MARKTFVYKITCIPENKVYVGRTVKKPYKRLLEHFSESKYVLTTSKFHKDMKKYKRSDFIVETLGEFDCDCFSTADQIELHFINKENCFHPNGYNVRRVNIGK